MPTSKLQKRVSELLSIHFGKYTIKENIRPDWLITKNGERLELDFLIIELSCAVEVQGEQHYRFIPFFHSDHNGYKKRLEWDRIKKDLCWKNGVTLYHIDNEQDAMLSIEDIISKIAPEEFVLTDYVSRRKNEKTKRLADQPRKQMVSYAKILYREINSDYPRGNRIDKLKRRLRELSEKHSIPLDSI